MKEIIVIEEDFWVKHFQEREKDFNEEQLYSGGNPEDWWHYKKEQVPETWEELKELCVKKFRLVFSKNINMEKDNEYIVCCWMNFYENGDILNRDGFVIAENRTHEQMWQIIKSLIGEE